MKTAMAITCVLLKGAKFGLTSAISNASRSVVQYTGETQPERASSKRPVAPAPKQTYAFH